MSPETLALLDKAKSVLEKQRLLLEAAKKISSDAAALLEEMRSSHLTLPPANFRLMSPLSAQADTSLKDQAAGH